MILGNRHVTMDRYHMINHMTYHVIPWYFSGHMTNHMTLHDYVPLYDHMTSHGLDVPHIH